MKGFTELGFKTRSKNLADFQESYGLEADKDEEGDDEESGEDGSDSDHSEIEPKSEL